MPSLIPWRRGKEEVVERDSLPLPFQDWIGYFNYQGNQYSFPFGYTQTLTGDHEKPLPYDYTSLVASTYRSNLIVSSLMDIRMHHFGEIRFQFRQIRGGRPGNLFGTTALQPLETPWPNGTTGDLLARMIQDVDLAGNAYIVKAGDRLARLRPDWVTILLGSRTRRDNWLAGDVDTEVIGYIYKPGGPGGKEDPILYDPSRVAHWAPKPDPLAMYRGMSWLTPVIREVMADQAMTAHQLKFMEQGATVNMVVKVPTENLDIFDRWVEKLEQGHAGLANAYKTMYLGAGAEVVPVGANMQQMDFASVRSTGETRLASAAGVPASYAGFTEGLSGASLNAGNFATARRRLADGTMRPLWRGAAASLAPIIKVPSDSELWYDDRDIAFLKDDAKEAADIRLADATTLNQLIMAGYAPDASVDAVTSNDFTRLVGTHSGLTSVQLSPPLNPAQNGGTANGSSNGKTPALEAAP